MQNIVTWPYVLRSGHSEDPSQGACAMDAVNWLVHGKHGDAPECACPVISAYVIHGNDEMPDDVRQRLLGYLHRIAGSKSEKHENLRKRVFQLAALRIFAPRALEAAGMHEHARKLRELSDDVNMEAANKIAAAAAPYASASAYASVSAYAYASVSAAASYAAAAAAASYSAVSASYAAASWDSYFDVLDEALKAGSQGEPWSTDVVARGVKLYEDAVSVSVTKI